jgi:iron complex outermembrane receptor protein
MKQGSHWRLSTKIKGPQTGKGEIKVSVSKVGGSVLAGVLLGGVSWPALSQDMQNTSAALSGGIEEIVVTAQKREQRAQDIGITLKALSGDQLADLGVSTTEQLSDLTPNLEISNIWGNAIPVFFIRGIGVNNFNANSNNSAGVYVDEVYQTFSAGLSFQLFDVERVEVLKGPQGTLYGRNTTAGAISYTSRRPTSEFEGSFRAGLGNYGHYFAETALSGSLSPKVSGRIAGGVDLSDGYMTNLVDNNDRYSKNDRIFGRAMIEWAASDSIAILFSVHGGRQEIGGPALNHIGLLDVTALPVPQPCADPIGNPAACGDVFGYNDLDNDHYTGRFNGGGSQIFKNVGGFISLDADLGAVAFKSITGVESVTRTQRGDNDTDGSPFEITPTKWNEDNWSLSQEFRLTSNEPVTIGDGEANWLVGLFYSHDHFNVSNFADFFRALRSTTGGFPNPAAFIMNFHYFYKQNTDSYAVFFNSDYTFMDGALRLNGGVRYSYDKVSFDGGAELFEPDTIGLVPMYALKTAKSFDNVSGHVGLDWIVSQDALLYASVSTAYKSGGFNGGLTFDPTQLGPFPKETVITYETGAKTSWDGNRLIFNVAAFFSDYSDLQVFTLLGNGAQVFTPADAKIYGLEADLTYKILPELTFQASAGVLDATIKRFNLIAPSTEVIALTNAAQGNKLPNSPDLSLSFGLVYLHGLNDGSAVQVNLNANYRSKEFFDTTNRATLRAPARWLTSGRLTYIAPDGTWRASLFGDNLLKERNNPEFGFTLNAFGFDNVIYGPPRTFGFELGANF